MNISILISISEVFIIILLYIFYFFQTETNWDEVLICYHQIPRPLHPTKTHYFFSWTIIQSYPFPVPIKAKSNLLPSVFNQMWEMIVKTTQMNTKEINRHKGKLLFQCVKTVK